MLMANKKRISSDSPLGPSNGNRKAVHNSKVIVFRVPQGREVRPIIHRLRFSEALAGCRPDGDILSSLCRLSGVSFGFLPLVRAWPWLRQVVEVPCGCTLAHSSALLVLCHIFDSHVLDRKDWSMQQLVEWRTRTQDTLDAPADK